MMRHKWLLCAYAGVEQGRHRAKVYERRRQL
jgi:hypothetical protein